MFVMGVLVCYLNDIRHVMCPAWQLAQAGTQHNQIFLSFLTFLSKAVKS